MVGGIRLMWPMKGGRDDVRVDRQYSRLINERDIFAP